MTTSVKPVCPGTHPAFVGEVERRSLAGEIRQALLSLASGSKDRRVQNLRKDIYKGFNKAPDTLTSILSDAANSGRESPETFASLIAGFFSARTRKLQRRLSDLMQVETVEEGQLNNIQMRVAQGDLSRPALVELKREVRENRAILDEMEAAIDAELFGAKPS